MKTLHRTVWAWLLLAATGTVFASTPAEPAPVDPEKSARIVAQPTTAQPEELAKYEQAEQKLASAEKDKLAGAPMDKTTVILLVALAVVVVAVAAGSGGGGGGGY